MGCKTCKQKKQKEEYSQNNDDTINLIPQEIIDGNYNGNFFFKLIAFFTIIIAIPFILLVLLCQLFISFFLPKSLPKVSKKFKAFMMKIFTFYAEFKVKRELKILKCIKIITKKSKVIYRCLNLIELGQHLVIVMVI